MKQLKIIISNYDDIHNPYYSGGGAVAFHEIGKRLSKKHSVTILCGAYAGAVDRVVDGISYVHAGIPAGPMLGQAEFAVLLPYYMKRLSYDIWLESFLPPHSTTMLPLFTRKPVIGITSTFNASSFSKKYHLPFTLVESTGIKFYRHVIATSEEMKHQILRISPNTNVVVIPNGIDTNLLTIKPKEEPYICFLGRVDVFQKGLDILLNSWQKVNKQKNSYKLYIIGDGTSADMSRLMALQKKYNLIHSVQILGKKEGEEKNSILKAATAVVIPSRFETFGMAVLETCAMEKPVIVSDIDGFKWLPNNVVQKVPVEDSDALADALIQLLSSKDQRKKLGKSARAFAQQYTWDHIAKRYNTIIESTAAIQSL